MKKQSMEELMVRVEMISEALRAERGTTVLDSSTLAVQLMLDLQEKFQQSLSVDINKIVNNPGSFTDPTPNGEAFTRVRFLDRMATCLLMEAAELKDQLSPVWKHWSRKGFELNEEMRFELLFEIIDIWCFMMNVVLTLDFTATDFVAAYRTKMEENQRRQADGY